MYLHLGIDDTDSRYGGCTTYVAAVLVGELNRAGFSFFDYPNIIRLNPNTPWKTRGNGAVALRLNIRDIMDKEKVIDMALRIVEKYRGDDEDGKPQPAVVAFIGEIPEILREFSKRALSEILTIKEALRLSEKFKVEVYPSRNSKGVIGALAAIGEPLDRCDYTYEILYYRPFWKRDKRREIEIESVFKMDKVMAPYTFHNIDYETKKVLITPRGPDPVIFGIRGDDPEKLLKAASLIKTSEPIERWCIFRTNQGTDAHLLKREICELKPYMSALINGVVISRPSVIAGGHVILSISDNTGELQIVAYREGGVMNKIVRELDIGDKVIVWGGVKIHNDKLSLNLEGLKLEKVAFRFKYERPLCPKCKSSRLKSMGRGQGLKCKKCGFKIKIKFSKLIIKKPIITKLTGKIILPPPRSRRHLTKPLERYSKEKQGVPPKLVKTWYWERGIESYPKIILKR